MSSNVAEVMHLQIPLQELSDATNAFSEQNLIAKGGFGKVYKGASVKHGNIAVKMLDPGLGQGDHEFKTEIALLSVYKHENIVSLLGFCDEDGQKILVYKYERNGSLDKHLSNMDLTWIQRLQICLDAARGLQYLHDDVGDQHRILHRDIKSANILLDENFRAKVSDFGLSKIGPANMQSTFLISNACGTFGYIDPDYLYTGYLTQKSDVYSFGVVLFEVLCGRLTRDTKYKDISQFLTVLVHLHYKRKKLHKIIHPNLLTQINRASFLTFSSIAYQCLMSGNQRPTMKKVVEQVQKALDNQLAQSGSGSDDNNFGAHLHGIFSDINIDSSWLSLATINHDLSTIPSSSASGFQNSSFGGSMQESFELLQPNRFRTYTKVYKSGSVGRSIDLNQINSYHELRAKLAESFGITGLLEDPQRSGWQLVFVDRENDILLLGDDPWEPFLKNVWYIKILSPEEVQQFGKDEVQPFG